jgi:hypothetical protein
VPGRITNGLEKVATMAHQRENNVDVWIPVRQERSYHSLPYKLQCILVLVKINFYKVWPTICQNILVTFIIANAYNMKIYFMEFLITLRWFCRCL